MATEEYTKLGVEIVSYLTSYIEDKIGKYKLSELTNGHCPDKPSVQDAHPLAIEYGNALSAASNDNANFTSILPAIGVEFIDDGMADRQPMGAGYQAISITQGFLDEIGDIDIYDRIKEGYIFSDTVLASIQAMLTAKGSEKLYGIQEKYLRNEVCNVSVWSNDARISRHVYVVMRSLLHRLRIPLSKKGVKNLIIKSQGALYNYEFAETLIGYEFTLNYINSQKDVTVNDQILTIKEIEEYFNETGKAGPTFTTL
jgi:hypothetical protein